MPTTRPFTLFNLYNGVRTPTTAIYTNGSILPLGPSVKFSTGSTTVPPDSVPQIVQNVMWASPGGAVLAFFAGSFILVILSTLIFLYFNRQIPTVRHLSFPFLAVICVGCILILSSTLASLGTPTIATCNTSKWLFTYGVEIVLAASTAKAYRIYTIFENKKLVKVTRINDKALFSGLGVVMTLQTAFLIVWTVMEPPTLLVSSGRTFIHTECDPKTSNFRVAMMCATMVYNGLIMLAFLLLAYKTRNVTSSYNESKFMYVCGQTITLSSIVITAFAVFDFGPSQLAAFFVKHAVIFFATFVTYYCLIGRLILDVRATAAAASAATQPSPVPKPGGGFVDPISSKVSADQGASSLSFIRLTRRGTLFSELGRSATQEHAIRPQGQLTISPVNGNGVGLGTALDLVTSVVDPHPGRAPECVEVFSSGQSWLLQFDSEKERAKWTQLLRTIAATTSTTSKDTKQKILSSIKQSVGGRSASAVPSSAISQSSHSGLPRVGTGLVQAHSGMAAQGSTGSGPLLRP
ncbi:7 transmembrane sweet-taste receptor of 3 GCPR-domain-containing protein [Blastocladiella britannica]|nr:7 transmembrane sweet-taste receptor of 3 GCPR-domain-containing protein [Blastocladiella britannica]